MQIANVKLPGDWAFEHSSFFQYVFADEGHWLELHQVRASRGKTMVVCIADNFTAALVEVVHQVRTVYAYEL